MGRRRGGNLFQDLKSKRKLTSNRRTLLPLKTLLPESGSYLSKLHALSVADTPGSALMLLGLLLRIPGQWPLLTLALLGLIVWNTIFGYVLAACSLPARDSTQAGEQR